MSGNVMKPEWDELDRVIDEDALMDVDNLCQETCELREEEVDITKNVMVLEEEALVTYDDKELEEEEEDIGGKTLHDILKKRRRMFMIQLS